jgi:hypothetical protein
MWKDYQTMRNAIALAVNHINQENLLFIALGEDAPAERIGQLASSHINKTPK